METSLTPSAGSQRFLPSRWVARLVATHWSSLAIFALTGLALWIHGRGYMPYFVDDSFISLRYSQRLLEGHGLTWTDGPAVEGYSNLLWVVAVAVPGLFGSELVPSARVVGQLSTMAVLAALVFDRRGLPWRQQLSTLFGCGLIAASGAIAAWSIGGLEQPLLLGLVCWALALFRGRIEDPVLSWRALWPTGALLGLASLTRPDAPLFAAVLGLSLFALRGVSRSTVRECLLLALLPIVAVLGQLAFRLVYYDDWVPNTFRVKVAPTMGRLAQGWDYVERSSLSQEVFLISGLLLALVALTAPATRRRALPVFLCLITWTAYVTLVGGDFFPQRRQLLPSVVLVAWLIADGLFAMAQLRGRWVAVSTALGLLLVSHHAWAQVDDPERDRAIHERWHVGGRPIGLFLRHHFEHAQPLLAVDAAGSLPYYSHLPCLDLLGLNDRYLAHHRPKSFGHGLIGHELGDANYVLAREPDLIAFWGPHGSRKGRWKAGLDLVKRADFRALYTDVEFETPTRDRTVLWTRIEGRVGVRRTDRTVAIPGYLLTQHDSVAREERGLLGLAMRDIGSAQVHGIRMSAGTWKLSASGVGVDALRCSATLPRIRRKQNGALPLTIAVAEEAPVTLRCTLPKDATAHVIQLTLSRDDG